MKARGKILAGAVAAVLASCVNDGTVDEKVYMTTYDIVTFEGNNESGEAVLTYLPPGDGEEERMTAHRGIGSEEISAGNRILAGYVREEERPGHVRLVSAQAINGGAVEVVAPEKFPAWDRDPLWLVSLWRSGRYINIRTRIAMSEKPRVYSLIADATTVGTAYPVMYVAHDLGEDADRERSYEVMNYASFDMGEVWDLETTEGVVVKVRNKNVTEMTTFTFVKQIRN